MADGPKSSLGRIRHVWRDHLKLTQQEFEDFARRLRLGVDFLSRRSLREWLNDRLLSCGLREIPVDRSQNPYDSLTQQFLMNGTNEFDGPTFRAMCQREGLLTEPPPRGPTVIAVRSFLRFAERIEDECSSFVCVANQFDGRHIRDSSEWQKTVLSGVRTFLNNPTFRSSEHHLLLECHSSLAFLAGYELDRKSGALVFPIQKGVAKNLWKPSPTSAESPSANDAWRVTPEQVSPGPDVALAISVTRDVLADVKAFLAARGASTVGTVLDVRPELGVGTRMVADANHAVALADRLADVIRANRPRDGMSHLFIAAPNALAFFVAQHRGALGTVQLYEFDFEGERGGSYSPSIRLPA